MHIFPSNVTTRYNLAGHMIGTPPRSSNSVQTSHSVSRDSTCGSVISGEVW